MKIRLKEWAVYACLALIILEVYISDNRSYQRIEAFEAQFQAYSATMATFLEGWSKYEAALLDAELNLDGETTQCRAVFVEKKGCE